MTAEMRGAHEALCWLPELKGTQGYSRGCLKSRVLKGTQGHSQGCLKSRATASQLVSHTCPQPMRCASALVLAKTKTR
jgi:hypothetical protein